jgi:hypothetical protein
VKNSSLEDILTVILTQLEGGFEMVHEVLDMVNRTKKEKKF